uniref:Glycosyltransferase n=1 Tax=Fagus sylvatica TaxID=28930 RepID=A0A2N9EYA4_FAGSY
MSNSRSSKFHVAMFPWFAYGHFTPYLHLSNKLAERGHRVSFLLPKGAQAKLQHLNHYPNLIHFYPLLIPHVDGLPPGAETASDVPFPLHGHLVMALDRTQDQVETILSTKAIYYTVVCAVAHALQVPAKKKPDDMTVEDLMQPPPGYPSSSVQIKSKEFEIAQLKMFVEDHGTGMSFYLRITSSVIASDAIAFRTYNEIEGPYCDYLRQQYAKPVLLTGPVLPQTPETKLDEKWANWLSNFEQGTVVYCAFGTQNILQKDQFQELLLGFELCGQPFLVALSTPDGCATIEEALPEGFEERVKGRGWVYGGWVPQTLILEHNSVGCSVTHCGYGSMWESLLSDCQIVCVPQLGDQMLNARLIVEELKVAVEVEKEDNGWISKERLSEAIMSMMDKDSEVGGFIVEELKVAVEVEREDNRWISKESLSEAIISVMDKESEVGGLVKYNHAKFKEALTGEGVQERYLDTFIQSLQSHLD